MILYPLDLLTIAGLMAVGFWLEGIGKKDGFYDELLAPVPLAAIGCIFTSFRSLLT